VEEEADSVPKLLKSEEDVAQRIMMCEQLDLPWTIKQDIIVCADHISASIPLVHIMLADNL